MSFETWMGTTPAYMFKNEAERKAIIAWQTILENAVSLAFQPSTGSAIAAQLVRLESDNRASFVQGVSGGAPKRQLIIFGVKGHPTIADTIMKEGYTFNYDGDRYTIRDIIDTIPGERQGIAEATR